MDIIDVGETEKHTHDGVLQLHLDWIGDGLPGRTYDKGGMAAKIGMIRILAPELVDLLLDVLDDMQDRDVENHSGGADWQECACGAEIARNRCDGTGNYNHYDHECSLTVLREVLSAAGER